MQRIAHTLALSISLAALTLPRLALAQVEPVSGAASAASVKGADGSETLPSGLIYKELRQGNGASPSPTDTVKVHYRGTFPAGKEFDSSYKSGQPAEFPLNRVIPCWTEGVQKMKVGGKAKLICPPGIAYGAKGAGGVIPPNATLHFDVELLGIAGK
ncbi:MAG: FKBP-type peptidyl-prolyl cis-trans isomerase [Vitreoscilla sp.]|jgi:FKBP-type peptidyl-prolyl cis-trans isomerase FkpA|nr:FKBP-type peptidyl-prolyl cis-trans isomerase [Vitreoscilla sp.]